jgi:hypothetical protein
VASDPTTNDAVIVLPGIMGTELVDVESGDMLWGLARLDWYWKAWTSGRPLETLKVTEDERAGRTGRIRPGRPLRAPAWAPMVRGVEPYTALVTATKRVLADEAALLEFGYDWRLSIEHNARELAKAADQHLERWRQHDKGGRDAKLTLVAHSMGGLVARYFTEVLGHREQVRRTITLGTPFYGAVKAVVMLNTGSGSPVPLPKRRLRDLTRSMPGLYDLLPSYRCVEEGETSRRLEAHDVDAIGGDKDLAVEAFDRRRRLLSGGPANAATLSTLVGVDQPTAQSLILRDGEVEELYHVRDDHGATNRWGDETVYRESANLPGVMPSTLPQTHGALSRTEEAISHVRAVLTGNELGPPLGMTAIGLDLPDLVKVGTPFSVNVVTLDDPAAASCRIVDADTNAQVARPQLHVRDGSVAAIVRLDRPGVFRVEVKGGGSSAVTQLVLAAPADQMPDVGD